jgi:hypothetical protein
VLEVLAVFGRHQVGHGLSVTGDLDAFVAVLDRIDQVLHGGARFRSRHPFLARHHLPPAWVKTDRRSSSV